MENSTTTRTNVTSMPLANKPPGKEIKKKLVPVQVDRKCGMCKKGFLIYTGMVFTTMPPSYQHKCNNCGALYDLSKSYPSIEYEEV